MTASDNREFESALVRKRWQKAIGGAFLLSVLASLLIKLPIPLLLTSSNLSEEVGQKTKSPAIEFIPAEVIQGELAVLFTPEALPFDSTDEALPSVDHLLERLEIEFPSEEKTLPLRPFVFAKPERESLLPPIVVTLPVLQALTEEDLIPAFAGSETVEEEGRETVLSFEVLGDHPELNEYLASSGGIPLEGVLMDFSEKIRWAWSFDEAGSLSFAMPASEDYGGEIEDELRFALHEMFPSAEETEATTPAWAGQTVIVMAGRKEVDR